MIRKLTPADRRHASLAALGDKTRLSAAMLKLHGSILAGALIPPSMKPKKPAK